MWRLRVCISHLLLLVFPLCIARANSQTHVLSVPRAGLAVATLGSFAIFAGGTGSSGVTGAIDIYDASTGTWNSTAQGAGFLSPARYAIGATAVGSYIIFAGGFTGSVLTDQVDAFDVRDGNWYTKSLSVPRDGIAAVSYGNRAFFAGGYAASGASKVIDVFTAVATAGTKIIFSGGDMSTFDYSLTTDVYDVINDVWITTGPRSVAAVAAIALPVDATRILVAGGQGWQGSAVFFANVDFYDVVTNTWTPSTTPLGVARSSSAALIVGSQLVIAGGFNPNFGTEFGCQDAVDIYDIPSNTWQSSTTNASVGKLQPSRTEAAAVSINGFFMFAGGGNCHSVYIDTIEYFPFPLSTQPPATSVLPTTATPATSSLPPVSQPPSTSTPPSSTTVPNVLFQLTPVVIYGDAVVTSNVTAIVSGASLTPLLTVTGTLTFSDGILLTLRLTESVPTGSSIAIADARSVRGEFAALSVETPDSEIACARIQWQATLISVILTFPIYAIVLIVIGGVAIAAVAVVVVTTWCLPRRSLERAIHDGDSYNRLS